MLTSCSARSVLTGPTVMCSARSTSVRCSQCQTRRQQTSRAELPTASGKKPDWEDVRFRPIGDIKGLRPDSTLLQSLRATGPEDLTIAVCIAQRAEDRGSRLK